MQRQLESEPEVIKKWYAGRNFEPVWNAEYLKGLTEFIAGLDRHGLPPELFHLEAWNRSWQGQSPSAAAAARLEITTTRLARGLPALTQDQPHRTEVWGFRINAEPAQNVTINAGKVRILPNASMSAFTGSDTISYGKGGATGIAVWPEDEILNGWMNLPMIDMGLGGIEGVAVEPMPLAADIAIPLSGTPQASTANGAWFVDPATFGSAQRAIRQQSGALVIGIRHDDGTDRLNPPLEQPVKPDTRFVYLAESPCLGEEEAG